MGALNALQHIRRNIGYALPFLNKPGFANAFGKRVRQNKFVAGF